MLPSSAVWAKSVHPAIKDMCASRDHFVLLTAGTMIDNENMPEPN
jgi:hypothetical protein